MRPTVIVRSECFSAIVLTVLSTCLTAASAKALVSSSKLLQASSSQRQLTEDLSNSRISNEDDMAAIQALRHVGRRVRVEHASFGLPALVRLVEPATFVEQRSAVVAVSRVCHSRENESVTLFEELNELTSPARRKHIGSPELLPPPPAVLQLLAPVPTLPAVLPNRAEPPESSSRGRP